MSTLSCSSLFLLWFTILAVPHFNVLALVLVVLTAQILMLSSYSLPSSLSSFLVHLTLVFVSVFFITSSLFYLYLRFEATLFPVLFIITLFGYQPEKVAACFWLLSYTLVGSLPLLFFLSSTVRGGINSLVCASHITGLFLSLAFLVKRPLFLLHAWLPIAHVEAPLSGSILLSGILLKMGAYGLWLVLRFPSFFSPFVISLSLVGSVICSVVCLRSSDLKSLIAYSSVVHMGIVLLGIYSGTELGSYSALTMMFAHTLTSPLLFILANEQYRVIGSRSVIHYAKLRLGPYFAIMVCLLSASNFGLPPFLSFFSELTLFLVLSSQCLLWRVVQAIVAFLAFCYSIFFSISIFGLGPNSPIYSGSFAKNYLIILIPVLILSVPGSLFVI